MLFIIDGLVGFSFPGLSFNLLVYIILYNFETEYLNMTWWQMVNNGLRYTSKESYQKS